jgi:molybdopterin converting factor small subunit
MSIKVCFHGYISPLPNLVNVAEVSGNTVGQCLADFVKLYPGAKERVFDENGKLREYFALFVNEEHISPEEIDRPIKDGYELHIVPLIDGG